jgi:hypothetical protein
MAPQMHNHLFNMKEGDPRLVGLPHLQSSLIKGLIIGLIQENNNISAVVQ